MAPSTVVERSMAATKRKQNSSEGSVESKSKKLKSNYGTKKSILKSNPVKTRSEDLDSEEEDGFQSPATSSDNSGPGTPIEEVKKVVNVHPDRAKAVVERSQNSREAHAKAKQLAKERKASKPLAESLARIKKIWERLRRKSHVPLEERKQLVAELFDIITGRVKDYVLKHDSVRVVQTAIKYANLEQKRMIAKELSGSYNQLAESKYAKFLIGKLLVQGDDEIRDIIVPEFFGHVRRLIKHSEASWILDDVYRGVATKQQKAVILREWYGTEFALFQKDKDEEITSELSDILAESPNKRAPIMRSLHELINHLIQKKMTGFTLLHDAMLQYFLNTKEGTEATEFLELLKSDEGDLLKNLAFTKSGSRLVCLALAYSTAKDRKQILRTYKDVIPMMAADPNAHMVLLAAFEVIDDTVLISKSIFPELFSKDDEKQVENAIFYANDLNARTTVLYLFQGRSKALFPLSHSSDLDILSEIETARTTTSKKDPEIRRRELKKAMSPYLLKAIEAAAADLIATTFGCQFVTEVLFGAEGDKSAAMSAIAATAAGDLNVSQDSAKDDTMSSEAPSHVAKTPYGVKMLKGLVAGGPFDHKSKSIIAVDPALNFADVLYPQIAPFLGEYAMESPFVVKALLESSNFSDKDEVLPILREQKPRLQQAATEQTTDQNAIGKTEGQQDDGLKTKKGKKPKTVKDFGVGSKGCALLLDLL